MSTSKASKNEASPLPSRPNPIGSSLPPRSALILLLLPVLASWALFASPLSGHRTLPAMYGLCSRDGAQISTMDERDSRAECLVVRNGLFADVGSRERLVRDWGDMGKTGRISSRKGGGIKFYRLRRGETVLPGLIDSHAHVLQYGESLSSVDLVGSTSVEEICDRIAAFIAKDSALLKDRDRFILGLGWDQTKFQIPQFPTAADLEKDARLSGRPIYLKRIDVHALWVSQRILDLLGTLPSSIPGGLIIRNTSGAPTGILVDNAQTLALAVIPSWTDLDRARFLSATAGEMLRTGLTSVHDASLSLDDISFLKRLDGEGRMPVRIYGMLSCEPLNEWCGDKVERYDGDRFTLRAVKLFTDGALGSWGAAMHEPYSDRSDDRGVMISDASAFKPLIMRWIDKGFQVASHAIGDRANTVIMDVYQEAVKHRFKGQDLRLRLEHAQIMTPEDIKRTGELGVIASFQPTHATSDMGYAESRIGPERIKGAYAWQSLVRNGAPIALGSDFPVEAVNPLFGIHAAVSRCYKDGSSPHGPGGWYPEEKLTLAQSLHGFTTGGAWASFQEDRVGSIEIGKAADFVVLDRDLDTTPATKILATKVLATIMGGRAAFGFL